MANVTDRARQGATQEARAAILAALSTARVDARSGLTAIDVLSQAHQANALLSYPVLQAAMLDLLRSHEVRLDQELLLSLPR